MKEYLKMEAVFKGELFIDSDCDDVIVDELSLTILESFGGSDVAKFALHAINSHDELVAEVERLRGALQDAYLDGCYAGWGMSGQGYNAEHGGPKDWALHDMLVTKSLEYMK